MCKVTGIKKLILAAMLLGCSTYAHAKEHDPSFNCRYAKTPDEVMICQAPTLADQDASLAALFFLIRNQMTPAMQRRLNAEESTWLRRRRQCGFDRGCIEDAYNDRMDELERRYCGPYFCGE
jgi:uncharacterized protein